MSDKPTIEEIASEVERLAAGPKEEAGSVVDLIEGWMKRSGGASDVVERYAASTNPILAGTVAGLLARMTSHRELAVPSSPLVLRAVELRRSEQWVVLSNLLTALQLCTAYEKLVPSGEPPPQYLMTFLIHCAEQSEQVQETLVPTVAMLHAHQVFARASREQIETLRARLRAIKPSPNSALEAELPELRAFLSGE